MNSFNNMNPSKQLGSTSKQQSKKRPPKLLLSMANCRRNYLVSLLSIIVIDLALTGFVCTHKIQAEEECLSSNVLCYECDSRFDPNCADPFDFSPSATLEPATTLQPPIQPPTTIAIRPKNSSGDTQLGAAFTTTATTIEVLPTAISALSPNETVIRQPKKLPAVAVCHGCCVKITSRMVDGGIYVKRTCTTNLQINYFMVGLVCMKESGDRGKMCFCETDYCNASQSYHKATSLPVMISIVSLTSLLSYLVMLSPKYGYIIDG